MSKILPSGAGDVTRDDRRRGVEDDIDRTERVGEEVVHVVRVARILRLVLDVVQPIRTAHRERAPVGDVLPRTRSRAVLVDPVHAEV